jgi:neuropeptide S receptor 1
VRCFEQDDVFAVAGKTQCWIEFQQPWQWQMYMTLVAVSLFVVPALIISGCYTIIVLTIWNKSKTLAPNDRRGKTNRTKVILLLN